MKRGLTVGGVTLLAVVGLIGWANRDGAAPAQPFVNTGLPAVNQGYPNANPPAEAAVYPPDNGRIVYGASPFGGDAGTGTYSAPAPVYAAPVAAESAALVPVAARRTVARRRTRYVTRTPRTRVVVRKRPLKKSALIVGGSAAGGAAIGAIAGGGKGAGIGAIAGGVGGLVYDRLTHKKKRVVVQR